MIIGIDGNEANQKIRVGSGVYAFELLKQFKRFKIQPFAEAQGKNLKFKIYLKDRPINGMPEEDDDWQYKIVKPGGLWTQAGLPITLWKEKLQGIVPDVFFSTSHYAPRFCPIPSVITVFDLSFIKFPELFLKKDLYQLKNWTSYSIKQAKKIITISDFSRKEILDYYKIQKDRVIVAYPGYDKEKFKIPSESSYAKLKIEEIKNKYTIDCEYLLYTGSIQPRKNLIRLIEAFSVLKNVHYESKVKKLKLVICGMIKEGRGGWMQEEIFNKVKSQKPNVRSDIIMTGYVSQNDLPQLMLGTKVLILPSLYEGFGIPVVEAMASGVPVVASNKSSLPEIVGDAAVLVDPYDVDNIVNGIKEACYNGSRRKEMIKKGLLQVKKFSWEESAKKILNILQSI